MGFKHIRTRIIVAVLPLALLATVSLAMISYSVSIDSIKTETELRIQALLEKSASFISGELDKNAHIAQALVGYASSVDKTDLDTGAMIRFMFSIIPTNKNTVGGGIWFEPSTLPGGKKHFGPYVYRKNGAHVLSFMYSNDAYNYAATPWYLNGKNSPGPIAWTGAYFDELSGITMLTGAQPFFDRNGTFMGTCSADMNVDDIRDLVSSISIGKTGSAFLLGMRGNYLASGSLDKPLDLVMADDPDPELAAVGKHLRENAAGAVAASYKGKPCMVYFRTIPGIGWKLAVFLDANEVAVQENALLYRMLAILCVSIVIIAIMVSLLARHFNAIIRTVNAFSQRAAAGHLEERLVLGVQDEFASIAENLNVMLEKTQKLTKEKSNFLSRMSHEIRTPMNAIIGMAQIAKTTESPLRVNDCLNKIEVSSKHALALLNDILDYSKVEAGKLRLDPKPFSLSADLDSIIAMLQPRAAEKGIDISLERKNLAHDEIEADALRLNQVIINLLSNAIKFTPKNGVVEVTVIETMHENGVSLLDFTVSDNGIGIEPMLVPHLFRPFVQATGIAASHGGTGLGLAITKNILEMMGSQITFRSAPDVGTTFNFAIRVPARAANAAPAVCHAEAFQVPDLADRRILVVDDIEINREIVAEFLHASACRIETAENGKEALDKFTSSAPGYYDLILMDMQMPVMDGCASTMEIRACGRPDARTVRIVAMTANVLPEDVQRAMQSGMDAHIGKPVVMQNLFTTITALLAERRPPALRTSPPGKAISGANYPVYGRTE